MHIISYSYLFWTVLTDSDFCLKIKYFSPDNSSISPDNSSISPDNSSVSPDNSSVSPESELNELKNYRN